MKTATLLAVVCCIVTPISCVTGYIMGAGAYVAMVNDTEYQTSQVPTVKPREITRTIVEREAAHPDARERVQGRLDPTNKWGVEARELMTMQNRQGEGIIVYHPELIRDKHRLIWIVIDDAIVATNGASKLIVAGSKLLVEIDDSTFARTGIEDRYSQDHAYLVTPADGATP